MACVKYHQRESVKGEVAAELVKNGEGFGVWNRNSRPRESAWWSGVSTRVGGPSFTDGDEAISGSENNGGKGKLLSMFLQHSKESQFGWRISFKCQLKSGQ